MTKKKKTFQVHRFELQPNTSDPWKYFYWGHSGNRQISIKWLQINYINEAHVLENKNDDQGLVQTWNEFSKYSIDNKNLI